MYLYVRSYSHRPEIYSIILKKTVLLAAAYEKFGNSMFFLVRFPTALIFKKPPPAPPPKKSATLCHREVYGHVTKMECLKVDHLHANIVKYLMEKMKSVK